MIYHLSHFNSLQRKECNIKGKLDTDLFCIELRAAQNRYILIKHFISTVFNKHFVL